MGADRAGVDGRATVRTALLKNLAAKGTELTAHRVSFVSIRQIKRSPVNQKRMVRGTPRVRTKTFEVMI